MAAFDARSAKLLVPGEHLTVDEAPGLRLQATASSRTWTYRYRCPTTGKLKQLKLGNWPALPYGLALAAWAKAKAERDAGRAPVTEQKVQRAKVKAEAKKPPKVLTVEALLTDFIERSLEGRISPKHVGEARRLRDKKLGELGQVEAATVTRRQAYDLIDSVKATPVQASELRRLLGACWAWAHDSGRLGEDVPNWWREVMRGQLRSKGKLLGGTREDGQHVGGQHQGMPVKVVLSKAQVGYLLRFTQHMTRLEQDLLTLYLWTGCRGDEICAMEGREVSQEPDGWWWTVPRAKQKMGRHELATDLRVPLLGRALEIVRRRMEVAGQGYLFVPVNKSAKQPHVQQKVLGVAIWVRRPECKSNPQWQRMRFENMPLFSPHDLRRTVRTHLAALGCPNEVGEAILGHIQPGVAGVYNRHHYDAERRQWLARIDQEWEDAARRPD